MVNEIKYSLEQNIFIARFSVSTPYPGTSYFNLLDEKGLLLHKNFEDYNQFNLVIDKHNLSSQQSNRLITDAYKRFYLRPGKFYELIIEIDSLSSGNLDILANRNEQIIPVDFTKDEKIIYINAAIERLTSF